VKRNSETNAFTGAILALALTMATAHAEMHGEEVKTGGTPLICVGKITYKEFNDGGAAYYLYWEDQETAPDNAHYCPLWGLIAEKTPKHPAPLPARGSMYDSPPAWTAYEVDRNSFKEPMIRRLLKTCKVGDVCEIIGRTFPLNTRTYMWTTIYSIEKWRAL
jgi:hypothetical protein